MAKKKPVVKKVSGSMLNQLEMKLESFFVKKMPTLPVKVKEIIVKFSPWLVVVALIMCIPMVLGILGISALMSPAYYRYGYVYGYGLASWISFASIVLLVLALPGLFKRQLSSWRLVFYSGLVMALYSLITFDLGNLVIGTGISMYILFQIKSNYK
ncbi:MAG TPA: hypothetical protein VLH94_04970 [Spirochaetia bacterium]|nr:hypothetical protein [Spirochaetia bacterium]